MASDSPDNLTSTSSRPWHGWAPLAITTVLGAVLVVILLSRRDDRPPPEPTPTDDSRQAWPMRVRVLPLPPGATPPSDAMTIPLPAETPQLHSVGLEEREGSQVLRIRVRADGDELIVDAATGRLLGVRDAKGKMIPWPISPSNATELPHKNS